MSIQESPLARKLGAFVVLSDVELTVMSDLYRRRRAFPAGRDLLLEGQAGQSAYILASGWVCSYKLLANGSRQIVDFQIPGDFLGLRSVLLRTADHNIEPITDIEASEVRGADLIDAFARTPRLATAILGLLRGTRRWLSSISSMSVVAVPASGWPICSWNSAPVCGLWA